jgi:hypothetical protein
MLHGNLEINSRNDWVGNNVYVNVTWKYEKLIWKCLFDKQGQCLL